MISNGLYRFCLSCALTFGAHTALSQEKPADTLPVLPSVRFQQNQVKLNKPIKATLDSIVHIIHPQGKQRIAVIAGTTCHEKNGARSWHRVQAVINYLETKGIRHERMVYQYSNSSDVDLIAFAIYEDVPPSTAPASHPDLRRGTN